MPPKKLWGPPAPKVRPTKDYMTQWAGGACAKVHALGPHIDRIVKHQAQEELTTISLRGREGTGKTTLARVMAHMLHERLDRVAHSTEPCTPHMKAQRTAMRRGYVVRLLHGEELKNLRQTMEDMPARVNRILIFDDASFMGASASNLVRQAKQDVSQIRHTSAGDVKVILMFIFHYSKALDPYLRDTHFIIHSNITGPEMKAMREMYVGHNYQTLAEYQSAMQRMAADGQTTFTLDKRPKNIMRTRYRQYLPTKVTYEYRTPYGLAAIYDGTKLQICVYPGAGPAPKPDPLHIADCPVCAAAGSETEPGGQQEPKAPPADLNAWLRAQSAKPDMLGSAFRGEYLHQHGRDPTYRDRNTMMEMIRRIVANGGCSREDLIRDYFRADPAAGERMIKGPGKRTSVPQAKREAFALRFGFDGLRHSGDQPLKPPTEAEQEAEREELR